MACLRQKLQKGCIIGAKLEPFLQKVGNRTKSPIIGPSGASALILCLLKPSFCSFEIISNSQTLLVYSIKGIFIITIMPMEYKETETQGEERAEEEWGEVEKR